jgi:CRP/FNR family transcriptional regulator, cyclic AMP receptor protein
MRAGWQKIRAIGKEIAVKAGQQIFREGQEANGVYIVRQGSVELLTLIEKEIELPISILREPGDTFGTSALVPPYRYSLSARCVEEGTLFCMETSAVRKLAAEDHDIGCRIMTNLAAHFLDFWEAQGDPAGGEDPFQNAFDDTSWHP